MDERWRLFLALPVPSEVADRWYTLLAPVRAAHPAVRWIPPDRYHLTLRFLGATDPRRVDRIEAGMIAVAVHHPAVVITLGGGGGLQGRSDAAWLDVVSDLDAFELVAADLDAALGAPILGPTPRPRPRPHLTVARRATAALVADLRSGLPDAIRAPWHATQVALMRSFTGTPAGSRYETLVSAPLGTAP